MNIEKEHSSVLDSVGVSRSDTIETSPFVILGNAPSLVPALDQADVSRTRGAGIVLLAAIEPSALAKILDTTPDPAVPIADFGGNRYARTDFKGDVFDSGVSEELHRHFAPILNRLDAIPFRSTYEDRVELTILRLAYSRATAIEATFDPDSRDLVGYALLGPVPSVRQRLEGLADLELLRRKHFTRTHLCGRCESARLHVLEVCTSCGGGDLGEQSIVHHYRCGWQAPESEFTKDHALVCPKCRRELRHYGVDYDKPGSALICRSCHKVNSEPAVQFTCLDCGKVTPTSEARALDWYHYDLTDAGMQALREGHIPRFDANDHLDGHPRAFTRREFQLLAAEAVRVSRRYGRPFTVGRFSFVNAQALRQDHGRAIADDTFRRAVDVIVDSLREADFICVDDARSVLIGLPETSRQNALGKLQELAEQVRNAVKVPVEIVLHAEEGDDAVRLLSQEQAA